MSGLNSLSGLNNVNMDFRPMVELTTPEKDGTASKQQVYKRDYLDKMFN